MPDNEVHVIHVTEPTIVAANSVAMSMCVATKVLLENLLTAVAFLPGSRVREIIEEGTARRDADHA